MFSYGATGDDWLDLDRDRARRQADLPEWLAEQADGLQRPMLLLPGNMQLFGSVAISRDQNPGLAVSISRERLVQNESFEQLKRFVRGGVDWMTVCYARERASRARDGRHPEAKEKTPTAVNVLRSLREALRRDVDVARDVKGVIEASLVEVETLLTQEAEAHLSELSMLRVLASAGTTVLVFDHTLRAMAAQLNDIAANLESTARYVPTEHIEAFEKALDDLRSWSSMATGQGSLVGLLVEPEARTRRRSLAISPLVEKLERGFSGYLSRFGITLENQVPPAVRTPPLHEAEVYAVLLNILTNSFKAVRCATKASRAGLCDHG